MLHVALIGVRALSICAKNYSRLFVSALRLHLFVLDVFNSLIMAERIYEYDYAAYDYETGRTYYMVGTFLYCYLLL